MPTTNWLQEIERENKRELLDEYAEPLFLIVMVIVALFIAEIIYDEYQSKQDHKAMSAMVAQCANGQTVSLGDAVMRCKVSEMVAQR